ncbi:DNA-processing protein DprA [Caenispirillum bisanense]|uniref:DNA-processing protein DprA n=1 Tax=Caenispirillum bisanense TaxID=414052 RepID=UPI0031D62052
MTAETRALSTAEKIDWLRLIRSENVGPVTFRRLLERYGTVRAALEALPDLARRGGRSKPVRILPRAEAERELATLERYGVQVVAAVDPAYPPRLRAVEDAPPLLMLIGNAHLLRRPAVAIVGARNASVNGRQFARRLATDLSGQFGLLVVSGLARGIDTAAHEGSLAGGTCAVMAGGPDVVYPPENDRLHAAIAEGGVIVSEHPLGTEPQARHFPRRNRIISGIAAGVVVIEASERSGSLITARLALEQGREVFAVPGSPVDPRCAGPNHLLREGATLVRHAGDVMEVLDPLLRRRDLQENRGPAGPSAPPAPPPDIPDTARAAVVGCLGPSPVTVDEVIRECQLSAAVVATILLELELAGRLERQSGNRVSLLFFG